jgi:hypothetical protein
MKAKGDLNLAQSLRLEKELYRLDQMIEAAHRSSIDIKNSYDFKILAVKEAYKDNLSDAWTYYDRSRYELTNAINDAKQNLGGRHIHSLKTVSFFFILYGLYSIVFGILSCMIFIFLIWHYSEVTVLGVPLWASFFAGLGSSIQILSGIVDDLRNEGVVVRYKHIWYMIVPPISLIFGYMAYLAFSSGLVAFNVNSQNKMLSDMFICFLIGFSTNWIINSLSKLSRKKIE